MYMSKLLPIAFLAAGLPSAMAGKCTALGTTSYGGNSAKVSDVIIIMDEDRNTLWEGKSDEDDNVKVCTDYFGVEGKAMGMKDKFGWAATCSGTEINECHGSSGAQTHIDGKKPTENDIDWFGIGTNIKSSCEIEFDCTPA